MRTYTYEGIEYVLATPSIREWILSIHTDIVALAMHNKETICSQQQGNYNAAVQIVDDKLLFTSCHRNGDKARSYIDMVDDAAFIEQSIKYYEEQNS